MGITLATYREWSDDPHLGDLQVKDMTLKTASAIIRHGCQCRYLAVCETYYSKRAGSLERKWTA
jgi:hypothetical protein